MSEIRNINLSFSCHESVDENLHCTKCSRTLIDFSDKTAEELDILLKTNDKVCGKFKSSQLSEHFLRYAASAVFAATTTVSASADDFPKTLKLQTIFPENSSIKTFTTLGLVVEDNILVANGDYDAFYRSIGKNLIVPAGFDKDGECIIGVTVNEQGEITNTSIVKGFDPVADAAALEAVSKATVPLKPARRNGKPVESQMMIPVVFGRRRRDQTEN